MKKFVLSLATLAALSTSALAHGEFNELERPENKTSYGSFSGSMNDEMTSNEGFTVVPAGNDESYSGTAYEKQQRFVMMENAENY